VPQWMSRERKGIVTENAWGTCTEKSETDSGGSLELGTTGGRGLDVGRAKTDIGTLTDSQSQAISRLIDSRTRSRILQDGVIDYRNG